MKAKRKSIYSEKPELNYIIGIPEAFEGTEHEKYVLTKDKDFKNQLGQHTAYFVERDGKEYITVYDNNYGISCVNLINWNVANVEKNSFSKGTYSNFYMYEVDKDNISWLTISKSHIQQ